MQKHAEDGAVEPPLVSTLGVCLWSYIVGQHDCWILELCFMKPIIAHFKLISQHVYSAHAVIRYMAHQQITSYWGNMMTTKRNMVQSLALSPVATHYLSPPAHPACPPRFLSAGKGCFTLFLSFSRQLAHLFIWTTLTTLNCLIAVASMPPQWLNQKRCINMHETYL